jgi:hypothetical protein
MPTKSVEENGVGPISTDSELRVECWLEVVLSPTATPGHLVVAAAARRRHRYVAAITGVAPRPGGRHVAMGTALMRLGRRF